jgi:uncharacterized lipoprotein YddW (UPF0748 family)
MNKKRDKSINNSAAVVILAIVLLCLQSCGSARLAREYAELHPKREFRGAWIQTVYQDEYKNMSVEKMQTDFIRKLNMLQSYGINAVIFQVRPEADAFYYSKLEPWSRFYTGTQGKAPEGNFDLMNFLIEECHKRNMEFHAWINPYRAGAAGSKTFADGHLIFKEPGRFIRYGDQIFFDPGQPKNREFICRVVGDIVSRYDIDAIHIDDYFYPYPLPGMNFPDSRSFRRYGMPAGYTEETKGDWRRENVNMLSKEMSETIHSIKPWVRFGVSPFGIYRNKKTYKKGSDTNGLQGYDDLYADVLQWVREGWIDYNAPQLYWEAGHKAADYVTLIKWWNDKADKDCHLYIGQDVDRTMKAGQLALKMHHERTLPDIRGNCFWPANELLRNNKGVADSLKIIYHRYPSLIPEYTAMEKTAPKGVTDLQATPSKDGIWLNWNAAISNDNPKAAYSFVVYRFDRKEKINLNDPAHIAGITKSASFLIPYSEKQGEYVYVVTALNRYMVESKNGKRIRINL